MGTDPAFRRHLDQLLRALDPHLRVTECEYAGFETYTVRVARGHLEGRALAVPERLLLALVRDEPVAGRILAGVLAMNAATLSGGIA